MPPSSSSSSTSSTLTSVPSQRPHFDRPAHNDQGYFEPTLASSHANSHINSHTTANTANTAAQSASTVAAVAAVREFSRKKSQNDLPPVSPPHNVTQFSSAAGAAALAAMPKVERQEKEKEKKESKMKLFSKPARLGGASSSKQHLLSNADSSSANTSTTSLASSASKPIPSPSKVAHITPQSVLSRLPAAVTGEGSRRPSFTQSLSDNAAMYSSSPPQASSHTHHKHQFLLRRGKDKDLLSSASSNSKPTSSDGTTLYSFGPSSPSNSAFSSVTAVSGSGSQKGYDLKHVVSGGSGKDKDGVEQSLEDVWPLIRSRVLPLFLGAGLGTPVEDLNKLLQLHIRRQVDRKTAINLIEDTRALLDMGMQSLDNALSRLPDEKLIPRLVEIWGFVFGTVLPYFEAVFLPLQQEFRGTGAVMSAREAREAWGETEERLDIRRMCLISYRDNIILPLHSRLRMIFSKLQLDFDVLTNVTETVARVLQCVSVLASVLSNDDKQAKMDELAKNLKHNWLSRGRTGRNRRGFVGTKTKRINSGVMSTSS